MSYVIINDTEYTIDTAEQIEVAQAALREAGQPEADVYAGEPDGLGDSYANGQKLFA